MGRAERCGSDPSRCASLLGGRRRSAALRDDLRGRAVLGHHGRLGPPTSAERSAFRFRRVDHDLAEYGVRRARTSGGRVDELPLGERAWVGVLIRDGRPRSISGSVGAHRAGRSRARTPSPRTCLSAHLRRQRRVSRQSYASRDRYSDRGDGVLHRDDAGRWGNAWLAELLVERLGRVDVHVIPTRSTRVHSTSASQSCGWSSRCRAPPARHAPRRGRVCSR